jgi:outer membrane protein
LKARISPASLAEVHRAVGWRPVAQHAQALEVGHLQRDLLGGVGAALGLHLVAAEVAAVLLLDRVLDRQAVAVPAGHVLRVEAGQLPRLDDHVLEHLVDGVAHVDLAVGVGRAVVQHEQRRALARIAQALVETAFVFPLGLTQPGSRLGRSPRIGKGVSGRFRVGSGAGWAARRQDTEIRGLGIDLAHSDAFDLSLGLRSDSGRSDDSSPALAGMGDVKRTIRARIGATWRFAPDWALSANWTVDAFNRGGGNLIDAKLQHERTLSPRLHLTSGMSLSAGGPRYMQTYHGVTAEQSAATGYPEYKPGTSLRDLQLFTSLRVDIGDDWVGVLGIGFTRTLGDVTDSPLTTRPNAFSLSTGIGWRF